MATKPAPKPKAKPTTSMVPPSVMAKLEKVTPITAGKPKAQAPAPKVTKALSDIEDEDVREAIADLQEQAVALSQRIKRDKLVLEGDSKRGVTGVKHTLQELLAEQGIDTLEADGAKLTVYKSSNSQISGTELLRLGVSADIIKKATITKPYTALSIKVAGMEEEE
jgi:hypothetical protein